MFLTFLSFLETPNHVTSYSQQFTSWYFEINSTIKKMTQLWKKVNETAIYPFKTSPNKIKKQVTFSTQNTTLPFCKTKEPNEVLKHFHVKKTPSKYYQDINNDLIPDVFRLKLKNNINEAIAVAAKIDPPNEKDNILFSIFEECLRSKKYDIARQALKYISSKDYKMKAYHMLSIQYSKENDFNKSYYYANQYLFLKFKSKVY